MKRDMLDTSIIDRDNAVTQLYFRVINKEKNEEMLLDSPFVTFFDLALTFHFLCHEEEGSIQGFRITNQIMNDWEYSTEELYEMAMNNMSVLFPTSISSMHDVLTGLLPQGEEFEPDTEEIPMFVLTNERGINGASAMLYGDKLEELSEFLEVDLFILPSSIHEVIVVPALESIYVGQMISLVREVNDTHVEPEEQLSDNKIGRASCRERVSSPV